MSEHETAGTVASRWTRHARIAAGIAGFALAGGAVAYASIPDSGGVIHGCYDRQGNLKVINTDAGETCRSNETALSWHQAGGPAGPAGPTGPTGPTGPQGPAGPPGSNATGGLPQGLLNFGSFHLITATGLATDTVATLSLPPGSWALSTSGEILLSTAVIGGILQVPFLHCRITPGGMWTEVSTGAMGNAGGGVSIGNMEVPLANTAIIQSPGASVVAAIECSSGADPATSPRVLQSSLMAVQIAP